MSLLAVRELAVARGGLRVVENLSFDLAPGQALVPFAAAAALRVNLR